MKTFVWFTKKSHAASTTFTVEKKICGHNPTACGRTPATITAASRRQLQVWKRRQRKCWSCDLSLEFLILALAAWSGCQSDTMNRNHRIITTPFGVVIGETILPASEDDLPAVSQFLGIPYGVAPSGQYRFNMAISAPKWTHQPKSAFKLSSVCVQAGLPQLSEAEALKTMSSHRFDELHRVFPFLKPESEDCLYMNIYVPERLETVAGGDSQALSVLVIVHGEDYGWGAGNAYNASILSAYSQTVVVTLNYRLGVYGFLGRCESNSCTGNAGLSDLVAALKMLSNILPSFGADPSSVTLLGWGSGASLISLLMASPITQPKNRLFRRAILLDGSALCPWAIVNNPQEYLLKLAIKLRCVSEEKKNANSAASHHNRLNDVFQKQISHVIRCVQEQSSQNLTAAARKIDVPTFLSAFAPIIDGQIVPNHPKYSFNPKYGALFRAIDLMVGTVMNPAHYLLPNADLENGFDISKRDKIFRTLVRNLFNFHRTEIFNAMVNEYTDWDNPKNHPKTLRGNVVAALSDALFTAPLIQTARMHSTDETAKTSNTFMFVFTHEVDRYWSPQSGNSAGGVRQSSTQSGNIHGSLSNDHLPYILGYPLSDYGRFTSDDKGISRVLMQYISNFVKSGDPSKPQSIFTRTAVEERFLGTPWPQYSPDTREAYLEISDRPRVKNYYRNAYVGFWNSFVPQLNRDSRENNVPEEHNFLPEHFKRNSFFGTVHHYASFRNEPFPPPPLPPTPFPIEALKKSSAITSPSLISPTHKSAGDTYETVSGGELKKSCSYFFIMTIAVGMGFLVLNLCIYVLLFRECSEKRRRSKKRLKYQSYTVGYPSTSEINFAPNSMGQFPPLNSSTVLNETNLKTDGIKLANRRSTSPAATLCNGDIVVASSKRHTSAGEKASDYHNSRLSVTQPPLTGTVARTLRLLEPTCFSHMSRSYAGSTRNQTMPTGMTSSLHLGNGKLANNEQSRHSYLVTNIGSNIDENTSDMQAIMNNSATTSTVRRLSLREQEPLLCASSKNSTLTAVGGNINMIQPGVSPTCPRHGRTAQLLMAAAAANAVSRANSTGAVNAVPTATYSSGASGGNSYGNGPVQVISAALPAEGILEEAQDKENKILRSQLEKALRSIQLLEFQLNERNSMTENLKEAEDAHAQIFEKDLNAKEHELSESKSQLADAKNKISQLNKENDTKSKTIEELHKRISDAFEASMSENYVKENGTHTSADQDKIFKFEADILRLEQRLKDVTEEKEYYKKHHQANVNNNNQVPNGGASNGGNLNDEFGRELMLANKRKYQLENRMKQLEYELKEAHSAQQTMERNLKNTEKLLWLEKERSATLESELHLLRRDLEEQRRLNDELNAELDRYHLRDEAETLNTTAVLMPNTALRKEGGGEQFVKEMENLQKDYDIKLTDLIQLKNKAEWRLGEMTQNWHDAKWRVGELEATISHKNSEIEQLSNRVKQLESVLATPVTNMGEELQRLRSEIVQISEEKNKVEWRLGEVTQFWNDAKWRVGELEGEVCQNRCRLEDAHRRISQLESWSNAGEIDSLRNEKNNLECRLGEITQALNDSKWRIGELEAELHKQLSIQGQSEAVQKLGNEIQLLRKCLDETREQKSKVEWRLGEVTQYWNDTKWRTGELQELINHKDQEIIHLKNMTNVEQKSCARNVSSKLNGTFILKKQPHADRHKWNNMILWENTVEKDVQMRRVWFEVDVADESQDVFLIGSFVNWECAIRCETLADNAKRSGVWLELPPGHHEFRFIRGGNWHTAANYGQWHNEFGDLNNWRHVD